MTIKPTVERLYLNADDSTVLAKAAASLGESKAWLLTRIVAEGLRVIEANGNRFPLPLRFELVEESPLPKRKAA